MTTKEKAHRYMKANYSNESIKDCRSSKFYSDSDLWFFTFPVSYFDDDRKGSLLMRGLRMAET